MSDGIEKQEAPEEQEEAQEESTWAGEKAEATDAVEEAQAEAKTALPDAPAIPATQTAQEAPAAPAVTPAAASDGPKSNPLTPINELTREELIEKYTAIHTFVETMAKHGEKKAMYWLRNERREIVEAEKKLTSGL